jgi:hypothetical protein
MANLGDPRALRPLASSINCESTAEVNAFEAFFRRTATRFTLEDLEFVANLKDTKYEWSDPDDLIDGQPRDGYLKYGYSNQDHQQGLP